MKIRIPLTEKNSSLTPIVSEPDSPGGDISDTENTGGNAAGGSTSDDNILPDIGLTLTPAELEAYANSRYTHPVTDITVTVPDGDIPVVSAWAGTGVATDTPPSDVLLKRITSAVMAAINRYFTDAARDSLFTRPLRVAWGLRLQDGTYAAVSTPRLLTPDNRAPLIVIREMQFGGTTLRTRVEIMNTPMALTAEIPAFSIPDELAPLVTHLDIIATRQCDVLAGDETVEGIRSYSLYGENVRVWHYRRLSSDLVLEAAESDRAFRVIASVPIAGAMAGKSGLPLPLERKNLADWDSYPTAKTDTTDDKDPEEPEIPHTHVLLATEPLDLGMPEREKRVRGVTLRGIFARGTDDMTMTLYGSHHRDRWHTLATARGPHIRFLRAVRFRWLRVEARLRRGATVDALTFSVAERQD